MQVLFKCDGVVHQLTVTVADADDMTVPSIEFRFCVPFNTKWVTSETFFPNVWT